MSHSPIEQEPGRRQKVDQYKKLRRAQKTAEKALGNITLEDALSGVAKPSVLIEVKNLSEQATGIIRRDLEREKIPSKP